MNVHNELAGQALVIIDEERLSSLITTLLDDRLFETIQTSFSAACCIASNSGMKTLFRQFKQQLLGFRNEKVDTIVAWSGAINTDKTGFSIGCQQHVVPGTKPIVNPLA